MAREDESTPGVVLRTWNWLKALVHLVLDGPATLAELRNRIEKNEKEMFRIKEQVAENSGTMKAILSLMPTMSFKQDSADG